MRATVWRVVAALMFAADAAAADFGAKGGPAHVMEDDRPREPWNRFAEHPIERTQWR